MPLARSLALRYRRSSEPLDDLLQVAAAGLVKAVSRYDPSRNVAFSSYAVPTIAGDLKRHFRDHSWAVRPPRGLQERSIRIDRTTSELTHQLGRSPTAAELAAAAGMDQEELMEAIEATSARAAVSLQARVRDDSDVTFEELIGHDDGGIDSVETRAVLDALLPALTAREREIVRLRFDQDMTQAQIAATLGLSQMGVSRIIRRALQRLRAAAEPRCLA